MYHGQKDRSAAAKRGWFRGTLSIFLSALLQLLASPTIAGEFHSDRRGYTLTLPNSWGKVPSSVLKSVREMLLKKEARAQIDYDSGFQPRSHTEALEYPYVLVQYLPYSQFNWVGEPEESLFADVVQAVSGLDLKSTLDEAMNTTMRDTVQELGGAKIKLEQERRRFLWVFSMQVATIGEVRGEVVGYFGRNGVIQVMFYSKSSEFDKLEKTREGIRDSFRFDGDCAYDPNMVMQRRPPSRFQSISQDALIGGVIGIVVALIGVVFRLMRRQPANS